jgi:hypothetical protein
LLIRLIHKIKTTLTAEQLITMRMINSLMIVICLIVSPGYSQVLQTGEEIFSRHFLVCFDKSIVEQIKSNPGPAVDLLTPILSEKYLAGLSDHSLSFNPDFDQISLFTYGYGDVDARYLTQKKESLANYFYEAFSNRFVKKHAYSWSNSKVDYPVFRITDLIESIESQNLPQTFPLEKMPDEIIIHTILENVGYNSYSEKYYLLIITSQDASSIISMDYDNEDYKNLFNDRESGEIIESITSTIHNRVEISRHDPFRVGTSRSGYNCLVYEVDPTIEKVSIESDKQIVQENYSSNKYKIESIKFALQSKVEPEVDHIVLIAGEGDPSQIGDLKFKVSESVENTIIVVEDSEIEIFSNSRGVKENQSFQYVLLIRYPIHSSHLPFAVKQHVTIDGENIIDLKYNPATLVTFFVFMLILGMIVYLYRLGKPTGLTINPDKIMDSIILPKSKDSNRTIEVPYLPQSEIANKIGSSKLRIRISGSVNYKYQSYPFNRKTKLSFILETKQCPDSIRVSLEQSDMMVEDISELEYAMKNEDVEISYNPRADKNYELLLIIDQWHDNEPFKYPTLVDLVIQINPQIQKSFRGAVNAISHPVKFGIGPTLSSHWIGIDPGTTGSCVASGDSLEDIMVEPDNDGKDTIVPSMVVFKTDESYVSTDDGYIPENIYEIGQSAKIISNLKNNVSFRSIKKILGYNNTFKIAFRNNSENSSQDDQPLQTASTLEVDGAMLTSLLLRGIVGQHENALASVKIKKNRNSFLDGITKIDRAVIAIPNNFTSSKLKQLDNSLNLLDKFQEKRYIYESEAVFMYYLFKNNGLRAKNNRGETVMIFDFGGATINISLINYKSTVSSGGETSYELDLLSKLGYAIGGDTIDYCILKSIFDYSSEYEMLSRFDPFKRIDKDSEDYDAHIRLKRSYVDMVDNLKIRIIENFNDSTIDYLLEPTDLEFALNEIVRNHGNDKKHRIRINKQDSLAQLFLQDNEKEYPLFASKYFQDLIYGNIRDACRDTISRQAGIGTIIFSGRSTLFPHVRESVTGVYTEIYSASPEIESFANDTTTLKSLVAKGACIYGIAKDSIIINNKRSLVHYGVALRKDPINIEYIPLIKPKDQFNTLDSDKPIQAERKMNNTFSLDNHYVKFYQVMGQNPQDVFDRNQKHKYSLIQRYQTSSPVEAIGLDVYQDENIKCKIKNQIHDDWQIFKGTNADPEISEENDEHYTWIIQ